MPFPLPFVPKESYKSGGRRFGANRSNGNRKHAGCDLIAPVGTEIYALDSGVVQEWRAGREFYHGTFALAIRHTGGYVVRYCEIKGVAPGIREGADVQAGQVIAYVGKMFTTSMLHLELYAGTAVGALTNRANMDYPELPGLAGFQRRKDLMDPTAMLDQLSYFVRVCHPLVSPLAGGGGIYARPSSAKTPT